MIKYIYSILKKLIYVDLLGYCAVCYKVKPRDVYICDGCMKDYLDAYMDEKHKKYINDYYKAMGL